MAAIFALKTAYADSDDSDGSADGEIAAGKVISEESTLHLKSTDGPSSSSKMQLVVAAPEVITKEDVQGTKAIDHVTNKEVMFNPTYQQMFAPEQGPANPFKTRQQLAQKNTLAGFVQEAHVDKFQFENQRKTFYSYGYAVDPSIDESGIDETAGNKTVIADVGEELMAKNNEKERTVFEKIKTREADKRKRQKCDNPEDIDGFLGPWGGFVDDVKISKPSEEEQIEIDELLAKRKKRGKKAEEATIEEKTTLHVKNPNDYQGRSYLHIPQDVGVNLKSDTPPDRCFLPKKLIHTWSGHTKAVSAIRLFPKSGHLLLSTSMDCKVKIWEVYNKRRLLRTYHGHAKAVRDACFSNYGSEFLTAAYDRYIKLWDTETGECKAKFTSNKVPYCVKFNPDEDKQNIFVAGTSDKKIVAWDTRSGEIVQEYDRHLGAVNTITFVDDNKRFVSTSDDKSLRVWEWDIPVDFKYIADPGMHSMPSVTLSPNGKWLGCQSLDNQIMIFDVHGRFRVKQKKKFKGHMVAGYACQMDFSPDLSYVVSGDGDGKVFIWDWKTTKLFSKFRAHDKVCIGCLWHPHETSKVITCGWDGLIKLWD
ncbi:pre-mRNA-processing factor 17-like [Styela clava]